MGTEEWRLGTPAVPAFRGRRCVVLIGRASCDRRSQLFLPCHSTVREQFCKSANCPLHAISSRCFAKPPPQSGQKPELRRSFLIDLMPSLKTEHSLASFGKNVAAFRPQKQSSVVCAPWVHESEPETYPRDFPGGLCMPESHTGPVPICGLLVYSQARRSFQGDSIVVRVPRNGISTALRSAHASKKPCAVVPEIDFTRRLSEVTEVIRPVVCDSHPGWKTL